MIRGAARAAEALVPQKTAQVLALIQQLYNVEEGANDR